MDRPCISVLLPVYNAEKFLDRAIESILDQTEQNFECIIVDDGSTDASAAIIQKRTQQDARIKAFHRNHKGLVPALNLGIDKASGTYLARMDADDIADPQRLQKQADYLDEHPDCGLVSCLVEHLGHPEKQAGYARHVRWINSQTTREEIAHNRFIESPLAHPSVMFRRELPNRYGSYRNGAFPEDYELWLRWLSHGVIMEKIPEVMLKWRDTPRRLSRNHPRYAVEAFYKTKAEYLARWLEVNNPHHPGIVVWGAGKTSWRRSDFLSAHGIDITHYIDVDLGKIGQYISGREVLSTEQVPPKGKHFIVYYVGTRGVNRKIEHFLNNRGYITGRHFIFAA